MNSQSLKIELIRFNEQQKRDFSQIAVIELLSQRSLFYDDLLHRLWQESELGLRQDLALIAVGGYGRQEMFPLSDLDILVLSRNPVDEITQGQLNQLFNLLWDGGLQLGTAVRTVEQCLVIGKEELSVATNMLESRFLLGDQTLWQQLMQQLNQQDFWPIETFFTAKMAEKKARYARYHNTGYNLEPDLKHSPGGLRDLHLLAWIMLRHAKINTLEALHTHGILYKEEYEELHHAQEVLFQMRFALHLQLKRYDNRLRFDRQLQLSEQLGFCGEGNQPVEQMMKRFFQATQSISQLTQLLLDQFEQQIISPSQKNEQKQPLDRYFSLYEQQLVCELPEIFSREPARILDLFYYLTEYPSIKVQPDTLRLLRLALRRLTQPMCHDPNARQRFLQLFSQPNSIQRAIVPMHQLGVLTAYLPQWRGIQGLMQFDLFHIYTVDEHTIRVMLNLEQFLCPDNQDQFPLCCRLFPELTHQRALIYFSALFHDIAKGRDGDHAVEGAKDMRMFAQLHGFNHLDTEFMVWLVEQHLTMSITAQRRDIHDPAVIRQFAAIVANPTALSALTCLTVADIHGTHDTLWNDWKRTLFSQLYQFTLTQLAEGETVSQPQIQAAAHRQAAIEQIKFVLDAEQQQRLDLFWQQCPLAYFLRNTPTQLVWHALHYLKKAQLPLVLVSNQYARGATEIFIHCHDQPQLFARMAHTLSRKKISIHDAQIITGENGAVLDSFIVTELNGKALSSERLVEIQTALLTTLRNQQKGIKILKQPSKHRSFKQKTRLRFLDSEQSATAFELFTLDREGLLAQIADIFNRLNLNLLNAKITTIGERVEDFFVVNTAEHQPLNTALKQQLQHYLLTELTE